MGQQRKGGGEVNEEQLLTLIADAHASGGEADLVILCASEGCGGLLAGTIGRALWCVRCGAKHERKFELRYAEGGQA